MMEKESPELIEEIERVNAELLAEINKIDQKVHDLKESKEYRLMKKDQSTIPEIDKEIEMLTAQKERLLEELFPAANQ